MENRRRLKSRLVQLKKQFGKGAIMTMSGDSRISNVEMIPTGIITLDMALGGGIPRGRVIEIYGPESSGKTTLSTHIMGKYKNVVV